MPGTGAVESDGLEPVVPGRCEYHSLASVTVAGLMASWPRLVLALNRPVWTVYVVYGAGWLVAELVTRASTRDGLKFPRVLADPVSSWSTTLLAVALKLTLSLNACTNLPAE